MELKAETQDMVRYFDSVAFGLSTIRETKRQLDTRLASDFNMLQFVDLHENCLSDIISFLLDPVGAHGQGATFLRLFLQSLGETTASRVWEGADGLAGVAVRREVPTTALADWRRRIDIEVCRGSDWSVAVENKPFAADQARQLSDYAKHLGARCPDRWVLIYLSSGGGDPSECSITKDEREQLKEDGRLVCLSYAEWLPRWLEQCAGTCQADRVRWFISDLRDRLRREHTQLSVDEELNGFQRVASATDSPT